MTHKVGEICPGCGVPFQETRPDQPGYLPPGVRESRPGEELICRSCYRLAHYGEFLPRENWSDEEYHQVLKEALSLADLALVIIDLLDFEGSWWPAIWDEIPAEMPVVFIGNKVDLLPKVAQPEEIRDWLAGQVKRTGRKIQKIILTSAKTGEGFEELEKIVAASGSTAVIGATNTGKSSLVHRLMAGTGSRRAPVVSAFPGTTLGVIPVQVRGENRTLLDTPGLIPPGRLSDYYCSQCASRFIPDKPITSLLYELKPGQSLLFGAVAALTLEEMAQGERAVLLCYAPGGVKIHRTNSRRIPEIFEHAGDWLVPPCRECSVPEYANWDRVSVEVPEGQDLAISGLGWISLRKTGARLKLELLPGTRFRTRPALIGPR